MNVNELIKKVESKAPQTISKESIHKAAHEIYAGEQILYDFHVRNAVELAGKIETANLSKTSSRSNLRTARPNSESRLLEAEFFEFILPPQFVRIMQGIHF